MSSRPSGRAPVLGNAEWERNRMKTAVLIAAALLLAPLPTLSQEAQRSETRAPSNVESGGDRDARSEQAAGASEFDFRSRMAGAIETVASACAEDIDDFCSRVTP